MKVFSAEITKDAGMNGVVIYSFFLVEKF